MKQKQKKLLSLIILPHSKAGYKRISLSKRTLQFFAGGAAFLFISFAFLLVDYFSMSITRERYKALYEENLRQKEKIENYERSIGHLTKIVESFENYAKKLNVMAGLKSPEVMIDLGIGGGLEEQSYSQSLPEIPLTALKNIGQRADSIEKNLNSLVSFFENQAARLSCTPTIWPTIGWVTSGFGMRIDPFTQKETFHRGIDIATNIGNPVVAPADGVVVQLKFDKIGGRTIRISHGYGYSTLYYHLDKYLVKEGQKVKRGDPIGQVGKTGKAIGPHLHYEVHINGKAVNPYYYILEEN